MKLTKKFIAVILSMALFLVTSIPAFAAVEDTGFSDVAAGIWYTEAVQYVRDHNIMSGTGGNRFTPNGTMTRAMLATVLYRLAGSPAVTGTDRFTDTTPGAWYADAVLWASQQNLITGYGNGIFGTDDPATREQFAAILWRYAGRPSSERGTDFSDESTISSYAMDAVDWARANGIISGVGNNRFDPKGLATRAQAAVILMGYLTMDESVTPPQPGDGKTLVAYFTWSNNTQAMAQTIAEQVNGDLLQIQPAVPYPTDYSECGAIARVERDENQRPAIANLPDDLSDYDTIFIGYPIWWHTAPMIIGTFLENYDLTGVDVYPFTQSASMDVGQFENSMDFVRESAAGANVHDGLFVRASDSEGIRDYLEKNGFGAQQGNANVEYQYQTQELYAQRDSNRIFGEIYVPQNAGETMPAVIFSHGFGGNYQVGAQYAQALAAKGYVVYCFDFCGGSPGSRSDGSTLEMSIFTEQADLEAVIDTISGLDYVDSENIFLMGTSQGGAVSAITAAANPEKVQGAVLLYPAFVLVDNTKAQFASVEDIPDSYRLMWMTVGKAYAEKLLDYDIYEAIADYEQDVLILHGDADSIVPLSYSEKALDAYASARLEVFPGAGHGFSGSDAQRAIDLTLEYLNEHKK